MIWLSPNEGHLRQTNAMIRLLASTLSVLGTRVCFAMRNFQKCTKSHKELSKIHKIP